MTEAPDPSGGLFAATLAALGPLGREVTADHDLQTFRMASRLGPALAGMVASSTTTVLFYAVHDDVIGPEHRAAVVELAARFNGGLQLSAIEIGVDSGILAVRAGVAVAGIWPDLPAAAFSGLLANAVDDVERVAARVWPAVARVLDGIAPAVAAH